MGIIHEGFSGLLSPELFPRRIKMQPENPALFRHDNERINGTWHKESEIDNYDTLKTN